MADNDETLEVLKAIHAELHEIRTGLGARIERRLEKFQDKMLDCTVAITNNLRSDK